MKNLHKRIIVLVLDSVGCGIQGDYKKYQSRKSNTLKNIYASEKNFSLPNLEQLGLLGAINNTLTRKRGISGKMQEQTFGNDTFAGIWEMVGVVFNKRFRSRKTGFSKQLIKRIENELGVAMVGNRYISGFKVFDKFYNEHKKRNAPILYFADDGVILLAAHENVIPAKRLNAYGKKLSTVLMNYNISRVITRPFTGKKGKFVRTKNRKDYITFENLEKESILPLLRNKKIHFITTEHLFNILGHPKNTRYTKGNYTNKNLIPIIINYLNGVKGNAVMLFCLQDFDMYGHKKDIKGYAQKLREFDALLPKILKRLKHNDLLFMTADHGCDPTINMRGHTREYAPLLIYSPQLKRLTLQLGTRKSFADIAQTICHNFQLKQIKKGEVIYEVF